MNKSITQATQNDKQISKSIKRFFTRFHVSSALKASNAYKKKGVPVMEIFQYLFLLIFSKPLTAPSISLEFTNFAPAGSIA